jgi:hypothetical protein
MKLRLDNNSLRLRVKKSDLERLQKEGATSEKLTFPNQAVFIYTLRYDDWSETINATFAADRIVVNMPTKIASSWINSNEVGLETTLESGLFILIEKDFPCKDRPWEDIKDTFFELVNDDNEKC